MSVFGNYYAKYYDLLYKDKDYRGEIDYIDALLKKHSVNQIKSILDIGCGTGRHLKYFKELGCDIAGVDLSAEMIESAKINLGADEMLCCADAADFKIDKKFDAVISLFHVMSYQTANEKFEKTLKNINEHLVEGGLFIFDFWYGPAVFRELPAVRIKRFENEKIRVVRIAEPSMNMNANLVDVNYEIIVTDKKTQKVTVFYECHTMRYFFLPELQFLLECAGFKVSGALEWMTTHEIGESSWYGTIIASVCS